MIGKRILVVDDSLSMRRTLAIALERAGYQVTEAENGQSGLGKLKGDIYSLIISDVNMPVMDGLSMVRAIKQMPAYKFVPIVMLTTEGAEAMKAEGKAAGVRAWVVKPFQPDALLDAVAKLVQP